MNMYPWWGFPPPQNQERPLTQKDIERGIRMAMQTRDHDKKHKERRKEEKEKKAALRRAKHFSALEWFIIGVLLHPIVGPLYHALQNYVTSLAHQ